MAVKIYEYYNTDSIAHKINPIVKIIWLLVFSFFVFLSSSFAYILFSITVVLFIQFLSKIPARVIKPYLAYFVVFFLVAAILMILFQDDAMLGILFLCKMFVFFISAVQFTLTTSKKELLTALIKMKVPDSFAFSLAVALRFLPTIIKEVKDIINAQKTRAYKIVLSIFNPLRSARSLVPIVIPLFVIIFNRSFELSLSSEARGFNPNIYRRQKVNFVARDWVALLFLLLCVYIFFVF